MAADPATEVSLCADLLRGGFTTHERVAAYLADGEAAELAAQLAERRGQVSFPATSSEPIRARLTDLAARALQLRLADPDQLCAGPLAAFEDREDMLQIAVGLARRRMRERPNHRPVEDWENDPATAAPPVIERDQFAAADRQADAVALEFQRRSSLTACSRGAHTYGEVDPTSGWSRCTSCGYTLVVDRRFGPGNRIPCPSELIRG